MAGTLRAATSILIRSQQTPTPINGFFHTVSCARVRFPTISPDEAQLRSANKWHGYGGRLGCSVRPLTEDWAGDPTSNISTKSGFGHFVDKQGEMVKKPQLLYARIGNHVVVGANTCIDRGRVGDYVVFGGKSGVADHISIVSKSITEDETRQLQKMWKEVKDRELGKIRPACLANRVQSRRIQSLQLANQKEIVSAHKGAVNSLQVEMQFKMPGKVYGIAMSAVSTTHMLIAAGTEDVQVRLCDIASGAFTHTLSGHRDGVWAVQWSASNEWVVVTGGCDGAIRFWDIRRAGCFRVLDQFQSQTGRRPPVLKSTATKPRSLASGSCSAAKSRAPQKRGSLGNGTKSSSSLTKGLGKGLVSQRQHPGMLAAQNRATAHYGAVTGLQMTNDGLHLFSAGVICNDRQILIWSPPVAVSLEEDENPLKGPASLLDEDNWSD